MGPWGCCAVTSAALDHAVDRGVQAITFGMVAGRIYGDPPFALAASATSGLAVSFSSRTTATCITGGDNGAIVLIVAAGTCAIAADQAGDANWLAAPQVTQSFSIGKAPQDIAFGGFIDRTFGDAPFVASASGGGSGNPVVFTSRTPAVCSTTGNHGTTITLLGAGTCSIELFQAGNANYHDSATIGATVTLVFTGVCTIQASQAGNANYTDATPVSRSFSVNGMVVDAGADSESDFNRDGKSDLVWKHTDGRTALWLMNGPTQVGGAALLGAGTGWSVKLMADLDGDGDADLVWQHTDGRTAAWLMNGAVQAGGGSLIGAGTGWSPKLAADFNADGRADILWLNADGRSAMWLMNGTTQVGGSALIGAGTGWSPRLTGDFNGDGRDDIVWQRGDGTIAVWLMNGPTATAAGRLADPGSGWTVKRMADFTGEGRADIVMQHSTGAVRMWLMDGTAFATSELIAAPTGWGPAP